MRLLLEGTPDTARDVPVVLDPARLVALQRQVDRVTIDNALLTYLHGARHTRRAPRRCSRSAPRRAER